MGITRALNRQPAPALPDRERIIADALVDVASELRLIDAAEFILMIRNDQAANLADLVNSSTELFFRSGTLRYALSASYRAAWDATPVVAIDLEFRHAMVSAFFRLTLGQRRAGVEVIDILFDEKGLDERGKADRLAAAFEGARLKRDCARRSKRSQLAAIRLPSDMVVFSAHRVAMKKSRGKGSSNVPSGSAG